MHLIGGLAEDSTPDDYLDLERAARTTDALGWSVYDYATTGSWAWPYLRGEVPVPTTLAPPTTAPPTTVPTTTTTTVAPIDHGGADDDLTVGQSNLSAEYRISFCHLWVASMVRMVPDFERMTSDWVLAPLPQ